MNRHSEHVVEAKKIGSPDKGMYIVLLDGVEVPPERTKQEAEIIVDWLKDGALDILYGRL